MIDLMKFGFDALFEIAPVLNYVVIPVIVTCLFQFIVLIIWKLCTFAYMK